MEALGDLLFELSNDDRLSILFELKKGRSRISNLSKTLDFTPQATTRNVKRLVEIGLVRRNESSDYVLTPYGVTALDQLDSYIFFSENKDYMSTHWTNQLPLQFRARLGELRKCERILDPLDMIAHSAKVFDEAEKWNMYIAPVRITSHDSKQNMVDQLEKGTKIFAIEEIDYIPTARSLARMPKEQLRAMQDHWVKGNYEYRYLDKINIRMFLSEKEVSLLSFPKMDGEVDQLGFTSADPTFHRWCRDLFKYYWARGITKTTFWTQPSLDEGLTD